MPAKESIVRRLNFCQWVDSASPWLSADTWTDCEDDFDISELVGEECYGGLDLSGTRDLTALALYFPRVKTLLVEFWTPKDTLLDRERTDNVPYSSWLRNGFIHAPPGHAVDYSFVAERIAELSAQFEIKGIGFDQYRNTGRATTRHQSQTFGCHAQLKSSKSLSPASRSESKPTHA